MSFWLCDGFKACRSGLAGWSVDTRVSTPVGECPNVWVSRLSRLCGCERPCLLDLTDFCVGGLSWARAHKTRRDESASQCGEHVSERWVGLRQVPRCLDAAVGDGPWLVAVHRVPEHDEGVGVHAERPGAVHRLRGAVSGLADSEGLPGVEERH